MLELIKPGTRFDFFKLRPFAFALSALLIVGGFVSLALRGGPNYGIDFTGGIMLHVRVDADVPVREVRAAVERLELAGGGASVQDYGAAGTGEFLLRLAASDPDTAGAEAERIKTMLGKELADRNFEALRLEVVGPRVGQDLRRRAILSVLFATVMMGVYIAFRFDLRFGAGAAIALLHDVLLTMGALSLSNTEIDLTVVAGLLTVVGYSVNDTVIVSDRIRENMQRETRESLREVINRSINETLSRTILTSSTALLVLVSLFVFGGSVIHGFAFALMVGVLTGTYSSIFIASPVVELWKGGAPVEVPSRAKA